jgi:hypothetical protein
MTYGTIYQFSANRTHQYRAGVVAEIRKPCNCRQDDGRGLRDVYATSLSLFARGANSAETVADPRTEGRVHRQIVARYRGRSAPTGATTGAVSQPVSRASTANLSPAGKPQWLTGSPRLVKFVWNIISIDYCLPNWRKSTMRWPQKRSGTKDNPLLKKQGA